MRRDTLKRESARQDQMTPAPLETDESTIVITAAMTAGRRKLPAQGRVINFPAFSYRPNVFPESHPDFLKRELPILACYNLGSKA